MATTLRELYTALGDMDYDESMAGFQQGLIYQGYSKVLKDKLFNLMVFKTPVECGADTNNSAIFNTVTVDNLSTIASRKLGEEYTPDNSQNTVNTFRMTNFGGSYQVDRTFMRMNGMDPDSFSMGTLPGNLKSYVYQQVDMKIKSVINAFNKYFITGTGVYPEFKGLEAYVTESKITPIVENVSSVMNQAGAQQLFTILNKHCVEAGTNTLVVNPAAYTLLTGMLFQMHVNNSMQKVGDINYTGISDMMVVQLPDECFTTTSTGTSKAPCIWALRIGGGAYDFGIAVPNDGQVLDIVSPFGSTGGGGPMVKTGSVELLGCIYPGVHDACQLIQLTLTEPETLGTNLNISSIGGSPAPLAEGIQDVNIASVGGFPVSGANIPVTIRAYESLGSLPVTSATPLSVTAVTPVPISSQTPLQVQTVTPVQVSDIQTPVSIASTNPVKVTVTDDTGVQSVRIDEGRLATVTSADGPLSVVVSDLISGNHAAVDAEGRVSVVASTQDSKPLSVSITDETGGSHASVIEGNIYATVNTINTKPLSVSVTDESGANHADVDAEGNLSTTSKA